MILPIVREPNPILHQRALPVTKMTAGIKKLIADMIETMHAAPGVGLAASQVGSRLNILVASADGEKGKELVLLNAVVRQQKGKALCPEGCLSVPGVSSKVHRSTKVVVEALAPTMDPVTVEAAGLMAQILQHETDHLQGHLYIERLSYWKKKRLLKQYQESAV